MRKEREGGVNDDFFNLCDYCFSFVLAVTLLHNYSIQDYSCLIIYSYNKVLLLKYVPLSVSITQTLPFAKIERSDKVYCFKRTVTWIHV